MIVHAGDQVKIRTWESMANEYGEADDQIPVPYSFTEKMRFLCGETILVNAPESCLGNPFFRGGEDAGGYTISSAMIVGCPILG